MWIAIGSLVILKIRQMRKKGMAKKLFVKPSGIGYKISKRFTQEELKAAAKVLKISTVGDKKTLIINILKNLNGDYKAACSACNKAKKKIIDKRNVIIDE